MKFYGDFVFAGRTLRYVRQRYIERSYVVHLEAENGAEEFSDAPIPTFHAQFFIQEIDFVGISEEFRDLVSFLRTKSRVKESFVRIPRDFPFRMVYEITRDISNKR